MHAGLALYLRSCIQEKLLFRNRLMPIPKESDRKRTRLSGTTLPYDASAVVTPESAV
jgi:hypothetical protein